MRRSFVVTPVLMVLVLSGCAPAGPSVLTVGDRSAIVDSPAKASADAKISGILTIDDAGCWRLADTSSEVVRKIVWPAGTKLKGKKISLPGIETALGEGGAITGGGGTSNSPDSYAPCVSKGDDVTYLSSTELAH